MSSPGQKRGSCGHAMASFDGHSYCACCRDKGKGDEPCISNKETSDCKFCNALTPEQRVRLATPSYKLKKEKQEAKHTDCSNPTDDSSLVDPSSVSVIGVVGDPSSTQTSTANRVASVSSWNTGPSKLNSSFGRISRKAGMASTPPASRRISQDTLCKWEKSARDASVICNQAASFNRYLFKVQQEMQSQLKTIRGESKGKASKKTSETSDELQFLMNFNSSITQAAAKAMECLTDFVFITMGNTTLARRDVYLSHLKIGIKPDTLTAFRTAPLQIGTLFPNTVIKRAEEEIAHYDNKGQSSSSYGRSKGRYHPYERVDKKSEGRSESKQDRPAWKNIGRRQFKKGKGRSANFSSRPAKGQQSYK